MNIEIKHKIESLRKAICDHDYSYYVLSQPKIADKEYDLLLKQLKELEDKYPEYKSIDSPTARLSAAISEGFETVKHKQKMLSLDNTYSLDELFDWVNRVYKGLGRNYKVEFVAEHKIDGVSASLTYNNGILTVGSTRGDGENGEDITENIKTIRAIPLSLRGKRIPDFIEIRGEVYMEKKDFEGLNRERNRNGEVLFANPRNAASGSLKLLDSGIVAKRRLNFLAHSLGGYKGTEIKTQWDFLKLLSEWGLRTSQDSKLCGSTEDLKDFCLNWQERRDKISYDVDGIVIKVNDLVWQKKLGFTLKSPRWAVAYKFPARQATTEVLKINVNVGRTGVITPTVELRPVECAGVIIRHATLHNFDEVRRLHIKEGDRVLIERAGDVIPKVVKVTENRGKKEFPIPKLCPACGEKIVKEKEEDVAYRCINPSCPAQLERALLHYASRLAMDIEGMGESVVTQLVNLKLVHNFADIYKLGEKELLRLDLFKDRKVSNLLSAIHNSKTRSLSRLIYALGIRHVGEKAAYVLAGEFRSLDNLAKAKKQALEDIYEVGPVMAESIVGYFALASNRKLINALREEGVNFQEEARKIVKSDLFGKKLVFTGELVGYSRLQAQDLIRKLGAEVSGSISKNTDFLVAGENPGSKYEKARMLGVKIINEKEFMEMIK